MTSATVQGEQATDHAEDPEFILVDAFCGSGGTTEGYVRAVIDGRKLVKVIAAINHDAKAIKSHWLNHPDVVHFEEDIRTLNLDKLIELVGYWRRKYPNAKLIFWASLECTNFSKAKGGQPRNADSRTLAEHLERYIVALDPDYIKIENVVEFLAWGPLDSKGKPKSMYKGRDFEKWRKSIIKLGYHDRWTQLNSANFGAYTSRNRLFGCFAKKKLPIVWPTPTHSKTGGDNLYHSFEKWKPVKEVLDFNDEGESIFNRKKDLSDRTLERIFAGLIKYVAKGDKSFIAKYFSGRPEGKVISCDGPAGTIKCADSQALVQTKFLSHYYINGFTSSVNDPCPTIRTKDSAALIQTLFLSHLYGNGFNTAIEDACPTLSTKDKAALVGASHFIDKQFSSGTKHSSIEVPAGTVLPVPKMNLVKISYFIDNQYGKSRCASVDEPVGTITNNPKQSLIEATPFVMPTNFSNGPKSVEDPAPTITADRHHHYIVNPSHQGHSTSIDAPCPVIIARQDKSPLYLLSAEEGQSMIPVYESDSEVMIKIKYFMAAYGLVDIKMRMLRVKELLVIQGFPKDYKMVGTQTDHKKFIGNSVHPIVPKVWAEALATLLIKQRNAA